MKIYVARHGQVSLNKENRVCGRTDIPLTDTGVAQAVSLGESAKDLHIDLIISSPMIRTKMTADTVSEICGNIPVITDERIIEQCYGIYETHTRDNPDFLENKRQFAKKYPKGESMLQVAARVYAFLNDIKDVHRDKTLLIVTHGGVIRHINSYFYDMTNEEFSSFFVENCTMKEYVFE